MQLTKNDYMVEVVKPKEQESKVSSISKSVITIVGVSTINYIYQTLGHVKLINGIESYIEFMFSNQIPIYAGIGIPYWFIDLGVAGLILVAVIHGFNLINIIKESSISKPFKIFKL